MRRVIRCLLYTSDAADERSSVDLGGRRIIKNTGHGNFALAVFTLELEMDYPSETSLCTVAPFPTDNPSPIFFLRGRGGCTQAIWNG